MVRKSIIGIWFITALLVGAILTIKEWGDVPTGALEWIPVFRSLLFELSGPLTYGLVGILIIITLLIGVFTQHRSVIYHLLACSFLVMIVIGLHTDEEKEKLGLTLGVASVLYSQEGALIVTPMDPLD